MGRLEVLRVAGIQPANGAKQRAPIAWLLALCFVVFTGVALAATSFPTLTGRVVDNAHILDASTQAQLTSKLKDLEDKSGIQLVVATVPSLQGQDIAPFANDLFRTWKLGEARQNNGVLLLVAPSERKVRIEVGYGLEGTLTDALSSVIIANAIVPNFKSGDFAGGVSRGIDEIIAVLTTDSSEWQQRPALRQDQGDDAMAELIPFIMIAIFVFVFFVMSRNARRGAAFIPGSFGSSGGSWSGGSSSGGGSDSGFSGGGGSSGGGGASGGW
ncbi:TPM domain-containing protein [Methylovirgula sp. 4M-Z18]|uniref:TPM domain-containing protein n=1 Tax=Methylovirgula sp. 4M-Z18 TaxID=2293567 RepID=UPI000E2FD9E0|nr:YgcG family protein [Methylovirgula sp. 4M-Z18]RFB78431.1 YgcG family protein [Methylovirgula sp. 4M-Z18]